MPHKLGHRDLPEVGRTAARDMITRRVEQHVLTAPDRRTAARTVLSFGIDVPAGTPTSKLTPTALGAGTPISYFTDLVLRMLGHRD
jgi:hypothetical protein